MKNDLFLRNGNSKFQIEKTFPNYQLLITNYSRRRREGFTLIEILIVVSLIGILAAVVIAAINPAAQRQKAREGVARANLADICQAISACQASLTRNDVTMCDSWGEIGTVAGLAPNQPTGASYNIWSWGSIEGWAAVATTVDVDTCHLACVVHNTFNPDWWWGQRPGTIIADDPNRPCLTQKYGQPP